MQKMLHGGVAVRIPGLSGDADTQVDISEPVRRTQFLMGQVSGEHF